ncbi:aldo/keto reductase [Flaviflexus massiliensis]|uniref:aldo/keto reductase n=1 Tax=Flaviflexus massiliensis TaxID=1522309 RepID=UPI0006D59CB9|nr:aldo/keto reductase [Flaviflexus massiliensis]
MRKRKLGSIGTYVTALGLGTLTWGRDTTPDDAEQQLDMFLDANGSVIDSSPYFGGGEAEHVLGELLQSHVDRDTLHIVSRAGLGPDGVDASRSSLERSVTASLATLGTDWIDTLILAAPDQSTHYEETADALAALTHRGLIHGVGLGNCPGWYAGIMSTLLAERGVRLSALHVEYNLLQRGIERELIPFAEHAQAGIMVWSALGRGVLAGRYRHSIPPDSRAASPHFASFVEPYLGDKSRQIVEAIATAADGLGVDIATVSLAWVLSRPHVSVAFIGPRTAAQLNAILADLDEEMPDAVLEALTDVTSQTWGYPERF